MMCQHGTITIFLCKSHILTVCLKTDNNILEQVNMFTYFVCEIKYGEEKDMKSKTSTFKNIRILNSVLKQV